MTNNVANPRAIPSGWDSDAVGGDPADWNGWLHNHSENFTSGVQDLQAALQDAYMALVGNGIPGDANEHGNPSDPAALARYQTALAEYNMFRMMQSNSSKNLADMQKQNARNLG